MDFFKKAQNFFGKCSESSDSFRKLKVSIYFFHYKMGHNTYQFQKLNFQEIPGNRGIHNSGYWKIAGLTACYFQGNSWKLEVSIIMVIGNQQAQRQACYFQENSWKLGASIIRLIGKQQAQRPTPRLWADVTLTKWNKEKDSGFQYSRIQ